MIYVFSLDDLMIQSCMGWRSYFVVDIHVWLNLGVYREGWVDA